MPSLLGIDIGTSSTKVMLLDAQAGVVGVESESYDVSIPQIGYAEQDPRRWWAAVLHALARLREQYPSQVGEVAGVGFSGQMHGLVLCDEAGEPVRPAILWLDQRSGEECEELQRLIPRRVVEESLRNRVFTGFALPSLLWVKRHEPQQFGRARWVMQPKDYIRYKMTGLFGAEVTDASATLLFDVGGRDWAWDVLERCGFPRGLFPVCHESGEIAGGVSEECAALTGLHVGTPVIYGMGDQMAQSVGNGVFEEGVFVCNIGTGGQVSAFSKRPVYDEKLRTQTFCHAVGRAYTVFGAILNAGMSLKWLRDQILEARDFGELSELAEQVAPGCDGLVFLPYLTGERTPHMDTGARGMFYGLHLAHTRAHMARAVMEGVTFALRDCMELLEGLGLRCERMIASGGGAASPVWLQIQADVFQKEIAVSRVAQQACLGASMLAGVSAGVFGSLEDAAARFVSCDGRVYRPIVENVKRYDGAYRVYRELYQRTKGL